MKTNENQPESSMSNDRQVSFKLKEKTILSHHVWVRG